MYYIGVMNGAYVGLTLMLGLVAFFIIPYLLKDRHNNLALAHICGLTLILEAVFVALGTWPFAGEDTLLRLILLRSNDAITTGMLTMTGATLLQGRWPDLKYWLLTFSPYFVLIFAEFYIYSQQAGPQWLCDNIEIIGTCAFAIVALIQYSTIGFYLHRYNRNLKDKFSDVENRTTNWFIALLVIVCIEYLLWFFPYVQHHNEEVALLVYSSYCLLFWIFLVQFCYKQRGGLPYAESEEYIEEVSNVILKTSRTIDLGEKIEALMAKRKFYLDPDIDRDKLAEMLGTNRTYLSQYLNSALQTTFYDYINGLRLNEAKRLMKDSDIKLEAVAIQSGYSSLSAFMRVFKKMENMTPGEWRKTTE